MFDAEGVIIMFIIISCMCNVHAEHANGKDKCNYCSS